MCMEGVSSVSALTSQHGPPWTPHHFDYFSEINASQLLRFKNKTSPL